MIEDRHDPLYKYHRHGVALFICPGLMWFRIFGYGLHVKDTTQHPLIFSERHGRRRRLAVGRWSIRVLS